MIFPFAISAAFLVLVIYFAVKSRIEANDLKNQVKDWDQDENSYH